MTERRTRQHRGGLTKPCVCPPRKWASCPHSWRLELMVRGERHRVSLDKLAGERLSRPRAKALAQELGTRFARVSGHPPPSRRNHSV